MPRLHWEDPEVEGYLQRGEPVVLTGGCPLVRALVGKWNFDYLSEGFGSSLNLNVHFAPRDTTVFARHYGKGLGTGGCTPMPFKAFARKARDDHLDRDPSAPPPPLRYYLQSLMVWSDAPKDVHGQLIKSPDGSDAKEPPLSKLQFGPTLERDMGTLGWDWLKRAYTTAGENTFDTCQLWVGHGGGATPLHFDSSKSGRTRTFIYHVPSLTVGQRSVPSRGSLQLSRAGNGPQAGAALPARADLSRLSVPDWCADGDSGLALEPRRQPVDL